MVTLRAGVAFCVAEAKRFTSEHFGAGRIWPTGVLKNLEAVEMKDFAAKRLPTIAQGFSPGLVAVETRWQVCAGRSNQSLCGSGGVGGPMGADS